MPGRINDTGGSEEKFPELKPFSGNSVKTYKLRHESMIDFAVLVVTFIIILFMALRKSKFYNN